MQADDRKEISSAQAGDINRYLWHEKTYNWSHNTLVILSTLVHLKQWFFP